MTSSAPSSFRKSISQVSAVADTRGAAPPSKLDSKDTNAPSGSMHQHAWSRRKISVNKECLPRDASHQAADLRQSQGRHASDAGCSQQCNRPPFEDFDLGRRPGESLSFVQQPGLLKG